ncbi:MAG: Hpt domain-containing protein [Bermanella sp.]
MSHLNMEQIQELKDIMEEGFNDLVLTYLQDSEVKLSALKEAIKSSKSEQVADIAHSLKGSSANICADSLSDLCKKVEDSGRNETLQDVPYVFEKIEEEFSKVKTQLQQLI